MNSDFFVIFSLSRAGSSALFRALNAHSQIQCLYEPTFFSAGWDERKVCARVREIRKEHSGIKHVWDPSGWPFVNSHISTVDCMKYRYNDVLRVNKSLLAMEGQKVLFLRRRSELARVLSDQLGQQTNVWTPAFPAFQKAQIENVITDAEHFKKSVRSRVIKPVDMDVIAWYLENTRAMEQEYRTSLSDEHRMDLWYEDLFDPSLTSLARQKIFEDILKFLGFSAARELWDAQEIEAIFDPGGKLNDATTLGRIPNIDEICSCFQSEWTETGYLSWVSRGE